MRDHQQVLPMMSIQNPNRLKGKNWRGDPVIQNISSGWSSESPNRDATPKSFGKTKGNMRVKHKSCSDRCRDLNHLQRYWLKTDPAPAYQENVPTGSDHSAMNASKILQTFEDFTNPNKKGDKDPSPASPGITVRPTKRPPKKQNKVNPAWDEESWKLLSRDEHDPHSGPHQPGLRPNFPFTRNGSLRHFRAIFGTSTRNENREPCKYGGMQKPS